MNDDFKETGGFDEVLSRIEFLRDGTEVLVTGEVECCAEFGHPTGENDLGLLNTDGFVSCEAILRWFRVDVDERRLVDFAIERGFCHLTALTEFGGGATLPELADILTEFGVPARCESQYSLENVADYIEEGRGVIAAVNGTGLWDEPWLTDFEQADRMVALTGFARDSASGELKGFFVNDSSAGRFGEFVSRERLDDCFFVISHSEGRCVVTDLMVG